MESFVVSALKYRPKSFDAVVGQESITHTLKNSLATNQLAQALLFCGPRGVGKTSCARILAHQINGGDETSTADFSFNIFELDAASNNSVEDIRKINEQVRIPPQVGTHKIYIIDEAHMLSNAAFNAFLKTLEEPPKHVIFILATTEKNKIIPTVLSRCQVYDFKRISVNDIQKHLVGIAQDRGLTFEENALYLIAQKAEGALRDALSIFDRMVSFTKGKLTSASVADNLNLLDQKTYSDLGKQVASHDIPSLLISYDSLLKRGIDPAEFIRGLGDYYRNLMMAKDPKTLALLEVGESIKTAYQKDTDSLSTTYLLDAIEIINNCEIHYKNARNRRVHVELHLMQLASLHFNGEKKKGFLIPPSYYKDNLITPVSILKNEVFQILDNVEESIPSPYQNEKDKEEISIVEEPKPVLITKKEFDPNKPVSGLSLSSIAFKKTNNKTKIKPTHVEEFPSTSFDQKTLEKFWSLYAINLKKEGKNNLASIFTMQVPELGEENKVKFRIANEMNKGEITRELEYFLPYLQKKLNNYKINIEFEISENVQTETAITPKEKYEYLVKINPHLETLRSTFDLDF